LTGEEDNHITLPIKVSAILATQGGERRSEVINTDCSDLIWQRDGSLLVEVEKGKSQTAEKHSFLITDPLLLKIVKAYYDLHPKDQNGNFAGKGRFFRRVSPSMTINAKSQHIGVNTYAKYASIIATWLQLPNPENYKSHGFRRCLATWLAEAGVSMPLIKIAGNWRSSTAAETYVSKSIRTKRSIAEALSSDGASSTVPTPSTEDTTTTNINPASSVTPSVTPSSDGLPLTLSGSTFHIHGGVINFGGHLTSTASSTASLPLPPQ
jgi:integrase